jgi:hypothetical protein
MGSFASSTEGLAKPANDAALLVALVAMAGVDVPLTSRLYVEPYAEGGLVLTRHRVAVDRSEGYRLPAFSGTAGIHLGWRFL